MKTTQAPEKDRPEELAILVHGTFAGDDADSGENWWQSGSTEVVELQQRLPENVRIASGKEVFHWSGDNGERARSKAAAQLLEHLRPMEESGQSYHLVGHSHGGSVIWNALKLKTVSGKPLKGLKSWTTVGTPFLHHSSRKPWHFRNLLGVFIGLALLKPSYNAACSLVTLVWDAACGREVELIARPDSEVGYLAVLRAPFLALGEWLGVAIERTSEGIHLGSFDPAGDQSELMYLFATREGLILLGLMLSMIYIFFHLAILCVRPVIESWRIHAEARLQRSAFERYGSSWLGLWSNDDEAINGLRATLDLSLSFIKRMTPSDRVFLTDNLALISRPYFWVLAPLFNRVLRPVADSFVRGVLTRSAQGNDRPGAQVVAVLPAPVDEAREAPPLPDQLQKKILREANLHAGGVVPKLRQLLGSPSFTSGLEAFSAQLSGKELVHTSYFYHSEVLDLISFNVAWSAVESENAPLRVQADRWLTEWFRDFKRTIAHADPRLTVHEEKASPDRRVVTPPRRKAA